MKAEIEMECPQRMWGDMTSLNPRGNRSFHGCPFIDWPSGLYLEPRD